MVQWLITHTVLTESLSSVPSTHISGSQLDLQLQGIQCPLLGSKGACTHMQTDRHIHTFLKNKINL